MQNGMSEYISRLVALRTLFESTNEEITRSEFETFSARLFERHPGMLRISWVPRVNRKERAEYEAAAITDGVSGYRIKSLQGEPSRPRRRATNIFRCSTRPSRRLFGLRHGLRDRSGTPRMLERARDNDRVAAIRTRLYEPKEGGRLPDVLVAIPVYAKGTSRDTVVDRRRNLAGFVVGVFDLPLLIQSIRVTTGASPAVSVNVYPPFTGQIVGLEAYLPDFSAAPSPQSMRDVARAALVGQSQDRRYRLAGARGADRRRSAGDALRSRGCGADRRHAADAVALDLSHARKPQFAAAVAGEPAGARTRPDRHPDRTAEPRLLPRPARRAQCV